MAETVKILIASSTGAFLQRFRPVFEEAGVAVSTVMDGYEALDHLENKKVDLLLVDGGAASQIPGLSGLSGEELSQMWRQIEGRSAHLVIGYVSSAELRHDTGVRVRTDPAHLAGNRGIDHHFWSNDDCQNIAIQLIKDFAERQRDSQAAIAVASRENVTLMTKPTAN